MPLVLKDRVKETTTTTSTGAYTLAGAVVGYQAFSVIGNGNTTYYAVTNGTDWEVGIGTYTLSGTTLSRDTILESSNSGNAVNWSAGVKEIFCTYPAERSMYVDGTTITPAISARLGFTNLAQGSALSVLGVTGNATADNASIAAGTDNQVLRRSGTTLAFGAVNLASTDAVTGDLPFANLTQIAGLSVLGVTGNVTADVAGITAGTDNQVLRRSGTSLAFGAVNLASSDAVTGDLPFSNLAQGSALSVLGVTGNATADNASIAAGTDHQVLRRSGTTVAFGAVNLAQSAAVTGSLTVPNGGTGLTTVAQGDLIYASALNTLTVLAKNTSATRYLSNTGTTNNPAWAQIDLSNGVTGDLPFANLTQGAALSVLGVTGNAQADVASIAAGTDHQVLRRSGTSVAFGAIALNQSAAVTGTLPVGNGGTGATTLTGVLKGNGTSAFSAATAGTDFVAPGTATTFTAKQTFNGSSSVAAAEFTNIIEDGTVAASAATGTINFDVLTQSVLYYTSNATGNWTLNVRGSSGTTLSSLLDVGDSVVVTFLVTNGATAYYQTAFQVDGGSVSPKWQGGTAPTAGNANSIDAYTVAIIKTAATPTYTAFASVTKFA